MCTIDRKQSLELTPQKSIFFYLQNGWLRAVLFALIWWILTDGVAASWLVGAPVVVLATLASMALLPPFSCSLLGVVRFVPFFLWRSLCGGADVARRALHPRLPISPGVFDYPWRLPPGLPRLFMANTVSLLPGTLSAELSEKYLHVHVLDQTVAFTESLKVLEQQVAGVFGIELLETDRCGGK